MKPQRPAVLVRREERKKTCQEGIEMEQQGLSGRAEGADGDKEREEGKSKSTEISFKIIRGRKV